MSMPEPLKDLRLYKLDEISPTEPIFRGVDAEGSFLFRKDLLNNHAEANKDRDRLLTERDLVAMALTEVCCKLGRGKIGSLELERAHATLITSPQVFYFPMSAAIHPRTKVEKTVWEQNACIYHRLPKLIYVPLIWDKEDQTIWRDMGQTDTFSILLACS